MIGISLAYLPVNSFHEAVELFFRLQAEQGLEICEIHLERGQFAAAYNPADSLAASKLVRLRKCVVKLGFHLPYLDLNPLSQNPDIAEFAMGILLHGIDVAADAGADYLVFHARGGRIRQSLTEKQQSWETVVDQLTEHATKKKMVLCFENADDFRSVADMSRLADSIAGLKFCLDLGHLFERMELTASWRRILARSWDRLLPWMALGGDGLPFYEAGGMQGCLQYLHSNLYCMHVHNHNGRLAHQPLTAGKIDLHQMLGVVPDSIPLVLEADYRLGDVTAVVADIHLLKEWRS